MPNDLKYTLTQDSITVIYKGEPHTVQRSSPNFLNLRKAIMEDDEAGIIAHLDIKTSLAKWAEGEFTVDEGAERIFYKGEALPESINKRIVAMAAKGESPAPLFRFFEKLMRNPSKRSVDQLWPFMQHQGIPILENGNFYAYKGVRPDMKDKHTGTVDNSPGAEPEMDRNKISDDPREACHEGYHVGALAYAKSFASRVVICEVDPENVVCIPYDSSQQKMRVCKYKVVGHYNGEILSSTTIVRPEEQYLTPNEKGSFTPEKHEEMIDREEEKKRVIDEEESVDDSLFPSCRSCGEYTEDCECGDSDEEEEDNDEGLDEDLIDYDSNPNPPPPTEDKDLDKPGAIKEQSPEVRALIHDVAVGTESLPTEELDEMEREVLRDREKAAERVEAQPGPDIKPLADALEKVKESVKKPAPKKEAGTKKKAHPFDKMSGADLMKKSIGEIRTYAAIELKIVGASKIPGGKTALVTRIEDLRKENAKGAEMIKNQQKK